MVMMWLVNSMEEEISSNNMCYSMAKELWDNVTEIYNLTWLTNLIDNNLLKLFLFPCQLINNVVVMLHCEHINYYTIMPP